MENISDAAEATAVEIWGAKLLPLTSAKSLNPALHSKFLDFYTFPPNPEN